MKHSSESKNGKVLKCIQAKSKNNNKNINETMHLLITLQKLNSCERII